MITAVCGSVRFKDDMHFYRTEQWIMNKNWCLLPENMDIDIQKLDPEIKAKMDELHLKKIDLADKVVIFNKNGYMGESTKRELAYALLREKEVEFLEPEKVFV